MTPERKLNVVMFSGGRGTGNITEALLSHGQSSLTLLVNTYDDGLSTGALRRLIPGMLGPSDIRKNVSRLIDPGDRSDRAMQRLMEYRFPSPMSVSDATEALDAMASGHPPAERLGLGPSLDDLSRAQDQRMRTFIQSFLMYWKSPAAASAPFDFSDCSLGNLFFAGAYLYAQRDFNAAVGHFGTLARLRGRALNITDGENRVLVGLKQNGVFLPDEASIVGAQDAVPVLEIFLLHSYLSGEERRALDALPLDGKRSYLRERSRDPLPNPDAIDAIRHADILIYGPGTQHSSLFPSYLTREVMGVLASNSSAEKLFIGNIRQDYEIQGETAASLIQKFLFYATQKGRHPLRPEHLITRLFLQKSMPSPSTGQNYVFYDGSTLPFPDDRIVALDWEAASGAHSGGRVVDELIHLVNTRWHQQVRPFHHKVTFIVPALNEAGTVVQALQDLIRLNLDDLRLDREILLIDGGSSDLTPEMAARVPGVQVHRLPNGTGRGTALREGISRATGNLIVFFPSDGEYRASDLRALIEGIVKGGFPVVYGSRAVKCVNLSQRILDIYGGNRALYLSSKYGGMLISILGLVLYNRFISDPLTGVKAFDARLLKELGLQARGLDLETELMARLGKRGTFILEVPVDFKPRTRQEGKKTTVWDGLHALVRLMVMRWV